MMYQYEIFGGLLIGFASALPLLIEGRVAGVSGYAASSLRPKSTEGRVGLMFVIGLILSGFTWRFFGGHLPDPESFKLNWSIWVLAGVLVGFGTRLGGGCTSGHGICGLGRLSPRSLAAVFIFIGVAMVTTFLMRTYL